MTAPTGDSTIETVQHAVAIAHQLKEDAAWLWVEAYWPPRTDRDRPSRARPPDDSPDHVPGERLALGVGNDRARAAYTESARHLVEAHRLAGVAVAHHTGRNPPLARRRPVRGHEHPKLVDAVIRRLRWLLDDQRDLAHAPDEARMAAWSAASTLITAHTDLKAVLRDAGGTEALPGDQRCVNCGDPRTEPDRRECRKCRAYRQRNGKPRPIRRHADAHAAKNRRVERGEDAAAEDGGVQAGTYRPTENPDGTMGVKWQNRQEAS